MYSNMSPQGVYRPSGVQGVWVETISPNCWSRQPNRIESWIRDSHIMIGSLWLQGRWRPLSKSVCQSGFLRALFPENINKYFWKWGSSENKFEVCIVNGAACLCAGPLCILHTKCLLFSQSSCTEHLLCTKRCGNRYACKQLIAKHSPSIQIVVWVSSCNNQLKTC